MELSIIILNYRSSGLVRQQLKSLHAHPIPLRHEVIVVDNNSRDGIASMMRTEFPDIRFIASPSNRGYGAGNNLGIKEARGRYILIVNPDIVLEAEAVRVLYEYLEHHPDTGIAGPKILNADGTLQHTCARYPDIWLPLFRRTVFARTAWGKRWLDHYLMRDWAHDEALDVDWLFGSCVLVRRDCLDKVGLFDERFFLYLEDTDWCRRFWEHGYQVHYVPDATVTHLLGRSSDVSLFSALLNKSARTHLKSFVHYLLKYRGTGNPHKKERTPEGVR